MTKETYFEMCDMMKTEPDEDQIPVEFDDLYTDVQQAMTIYYKLRDEWDTMNGNYMGKNFAGMLDIFDVLEVPIEDRRTMFDLIGIIDEHRSKVIRDKKPKT